MFYTPFFFSGMLSVLFFGNFLQLCDYDDDDDGEGGGESHIIHRLSSENLD